MSQRKYASSYRRSDLFTCVACGQETGPFVEVEEDDSGVPYLPPGWARITVERVIESPDFVEASEQRANRVETQIAAVLADNPNADQNALRDLLEANTPEVDLEQWAIEKTILALAPDQFGLLEQLGAEKEAEV